MKAAKFFNKKNTYSVLALSIMAFCSQASASIYEKNNSSGKWESAASYDSWLDPSLKGEVFYGTDGSISDITNGSIISNNKGYALLAFNNGTINVKDTNIDISSTTTTKDLEAVGVGAVTISKKEASGDVTAFTDGGTINLGEAGVTQNINISATASQGSATGIYALRSVNDPDKSNGIFAKPSFVNIEGENLTITANSANGCAVGIWAQNNTGEKGNESTVTINANNTVINAVSGDKTADSSGEYKNIGVVAYSSSKVYLNNNVTINAGTAISTRGGSVIKINEAGNGTVKINGDINFNYDAPTSGTAVDATVDINLTNKDSFLNGNIFVNGNPFPPSGKETVTAMKMGLSNGATWSLDTGSFVNDLNIHGGIINVNSTTYSKTDATGTKETQTTLDIGNISGNGGTVNLAANVEDGAITDTAKVAISAIAEGSTPTLNMGFKGVTADDIKDSKEALAKFDDAVAISSSNNGVIQVRTIAEGDINGAITQIVDADGKKSAVSHASNSKIESYSSMLSLATAQWRHELNSLSKRLGEVRSAPKSVGLWARAYGSEMEYGPQDVTLENNTIQIGFDTDLGAGFKVGSAISYTDGSTSALNGSADNDLYGFALYGTYLADNGIYADLIGKYSRISNDFRFQNFSGSYDNNAYSLSLETGWNFKLNDIVFIEPQAEFTYGKILGDDFTAGNGVTINQEDTDTTIIRGGLRAGFNLPEDKGLIYAKASIVHDFDSESAFNASQYNAASDRVNSVYVEDDLGGTWAEYGIGANINWTDNCYTYIEIERTSGSDLTENYRWNLGMRYSF